MKKIPLGPGRFIKKKKNNIYMFRLSELNSEIEKGLEFYSPPPFHKKMYFLLLNFFLLSYLFILWSWIEYATLKMHNTYVLYILTSFLYST